MIDALFNVLNFALLLALGVYCFKRYVIPALKTEIVADKVDKLNLEHEYNSLEEAQQQLQEQMKAQEELYKDLKIKVHSWNQAFSQAEQQKIALHEQLLSELIHKYEYQEAQKTLYRVQKKIMPQAITKAQQELEQKFQSPQAGLVYINQVLDAMRKN